MLIFVAVFICPKSEFSVCTGTVPRFFFFEVFLNYFLVAIIRYILIHSSHLYIRHLSVTPVTLKPRKIVTFTFLHPLFPGNITSITRGYMSYVL